MKEYTNLAIIRSKVKDVDYLHFSAWEIVLNYLYDLWQYGVKPNGTACFFKGMTVLNFKRLWYDRIDTVRHLYKELVKHQKDFVKAQDIFLEL